MRCLNQSEIPAIHGAHAFETLFTLIEIPHLFMGLREFVNYSIERYQNGCTNIEDGDHFTQYFCGYPTHD